MPGQALLSDAAMAAYNQHVSYVRSPILKPLLSPAQPQFYDSAAVGENEAGSYTLELPASRPGTARCPYIVAQLDDYQGLARQDFRWRPPLTFSLRARMLNAHVPGTWGFGLWNDPFAMGVGGWGLRLPVLPNAAWFFYASPPNYLSFRDDLPAQGFLAAVFRSSQIPTPWLALASPLLGMCLAPLTARLLRRWIAHFVRQDALALDEFPFLTPARLAEWHVYRITWRAEAVEFFVDGQRLLTTSVSPRGPLGLVLWLDNQYAAFRPDGQIAFGALPLASGSRLEAADLMLTNA